MIDQLVLDRALARWKARQAGGAAAYPDDRTPGPTDVGAQAITANSESAPEGSWDSSYETAPGPEMVGDTGSGSLLVDDSDGTPR